MSRTTPADAFSTCLYAIDTNDRALFASCCVNDSSMSVVAGPIVMNGWEEVKAFFKRLFEGMVTLHLAGGVRVQMEMVGNRDGKEGEGAGGKNGGKERATLTAQVVAYHVKPEDAFSVEEKKYVAGCLYDVGMVKVGGSEDGEKGGEEGKEVWKVQRWEIGVLWTTGDRAVLHG